MVESGEWGRRLLSVGFAFVGVVFVACAVAMVAIYGATLGAVWYEQLIYSTAHVAIHLFGMLAAFSIAVLWMDGRRWLAPIVAIAMALGGVYGITNMVGFAAKARLSTSEAVQVNNDRAREKYERDRADIIAQRDASEHKAMDMDRSKAERIAYRKQQHDYETKLGALQPPMATAANVMPDGAAGVLSEILPTSLHKLQWVLCVPVAVLSYLFEALCFFLSVRVWPRKGPATARISSELLNEVDEFEVPLFVPDRVTLPAPANDEAEILEPTEALPSEPEEAPLTLKAAVARKAETLPPCRKVRNSIDALADLVNVVLPHCGSIPSQAFLANRWRANKERTSKWVRAFERHAFVQRRVTKRPLGGVMMQITRPREEAVPAAA